MREIPEFRIVGPASEAGKHKARRIIEDRFSKHQESLPPRHQELLRKFEYPKSPQEAELLDFANRETNRLLEELGAEPFDVPAQNCHIVPSEIYKQITDSEGAAVTVYNNQAIYFDAAHYRDNPVYFGASALHEMLHLKGDRAIEVEDAPKKEEEKPTEPGSEPQIRTNYYRTGIGVNAEYSLGHRGRFHRHFNGLNEAIVAETEKRLLDKLMEHPALAKEKAEFESEETRKFRGNLATHDEIPEGDIIWAKKVGPDRWRPTKLGYPRQREVLNYACEEIQKQFPEKYADADEVLKEFQRSHFTGRLMLIGRLVEKTFGEGSFRLLGNMGTDDTSGTLHLESLHKARMRKLREDAKTKEKK